MANTAEPHSTTDLAAAADQIKAHLKTAPDDLKGWTLLGRTLASLSRFSEARDAYNHAIALAPDNTSLHAEFGEVLVLEAQGKVTPGAEAEFAKAPDDPRSRYYAAEAALQQGDPDEAKTEIAGIAGERAGRCPVAANRRGSSCRTVLKRQRDRIRSFRGRCGRGCPRYRPYRAGCRRRTIDDTRSAGENDPRHGGGSGATARTAPRRQSRLGAARPCL